MKLTPKAFEAWLEKQPKRRTFGVRRSFTWRDAPFCPIAHWSGLSPGGVVDRGEPKSSWVGEFVTRVDRETKGERITASRCLTILRELPR